MKNNERLKADYDRDGYVVCRKVLDGDLVAEASNHVEWLMKKNPELRPEQLHHFLVWKDAFWVRLVSDSRLLDLMEPIIGPNIGLFASHYIAKPPSVGQEVLYHQDGSYWVGLDPIEVTSGWLAVTESTPENGCMRVIPGSHTMELQKLEERKDTPNVLSSEMPKETYDESKAVDIILEPGDISIHHPHLAHGSNANTSSRWRKGLTIRYVPTTTRINRDEGDPDGILLRGDAVDGINDYVPIPRWEEGLSMPFKGQEQWNAALEAEQTA